MRTYGYSLTGGILTSAIRKYARIITCKLWERNELRPHFTLLDGDLCANLFHLLGDLLSLFLGDTLFNRLGSLVNHCLRLLQAKTGQFAHYLNNVDLVRPDLCQDCIELSLLLNGSSSRRSFCSCYWTGCGCYWCSAHAPLILQSLGQFDQFQYVQLLNFANNGIDRHVFFLSFYYASAYAALIFLMRLKEVCCSNA